jgi:hypothetical protein
MTDDDIDNQNELDNIVRIVCALLGSEKAFRNDEELVGRANRIYELILDKINDPPPDD